MTNTMTNTNNNWTPERLIMILEETVYDKTYCYGDIKYLIESRPIPEPDDDYQVTLYATSHLNSLHQLKVVLAFEYNQAVYYIPHLNMPDLLLLLKLKQLNYLILPQEEVLSIQQLEEELYSVPSY